MQYKDNFKEYKFALLDQNLLIHPDKALYWIEKKMLVIADLHFGKATHFRKSGIPIPENVHRDDFINLEKLLDHFQPEKLVFLGDLFHSDWNAAWNDFYTFIVHQVGFPPDLVAGNHDVLNKEHYHFMNLHEDTLIADPFIFSHKPLQQHEIGKYYNISGHLHPGITLGGPGKQYLKVPCFYFGKKNGILPAFGNFTGTSRIVPNLAEDSIFAIADGKVIPFHKKIS